MNDKFARFNLLIGEQNIQKIKGKTVLVLGIGGVGGYVVESLVRSTIENIIIVDNDIIDSTNINRQIIALESTIGKKKVDILEKRIKDINPKCNVIKIDKFINEKNYLELFQYKIDYLADCCDSIKTKKQVIKYALEQDIKIISSMGIGNRMDPTKLEIINIKKTSGDPIARILRKFLKDENINKKLNVLYSSEIPKKKEKEIATSIFTPAIGGLLIANHIIQEFIK